MNQINQKDWISKWAIYSTNKVAVQDGETGRTLTYGQLDTLGRYLAYRLTINYGLQKGDRLAVLAENCLEYIVLFVAAQKSGVILVPLNYRLAAPEIEFLLSDAAPSLLLYADEYQNLADQLKTKEEFPGLAFSAFSPLDPPPGTGIPQTAEVSIEDDDPIFILYTSGTTGYPKGAIYTHAMLFWNSVNTSLSLGLNASSRTINVMPPFHTGGWNVLTTPFLHHGAYVCLLRKYDAAAILRLLKEEAATVFMGVPTMLKMMAETPDFEQLDCPDLNYIIVGGEAMPIPLIKKWQAKGIPIRQGYGMTEVGPNLTSLHETDAIRKIGSIGRTNFYVEAKIMLDDSTPALAGESGELWLRGPMVTPGYWRNEPATRTAFAGDWFKTGDIVTMDEEGYLYVVDRSKNMFISGGENVYPAEVERVLLQHPAISEVVVIGVPDPKWGEVGKALVVLVPGSELSAERLIAFGLEQLAKFKVPKSIEYLSELPRNTTGKVDRRSLTTMQGLS